MASLPLTWNHASRNRSTCFALPGNGLGSSRGPASTNLEKNISTANNLVKRTYFIELIFKVIERGNRSVPLRSSQRAVLADQGLIGVKISTGNILSAPLKCYWPGGPIFQDTGGL